LIKSFIFEAVPELQVSGQACFDMEKSAAIGQAEE
jgi:hypothetical protein